MNTVLRSQQQLQKRLVVRLLERPGIDSLVMPTQLLSQGKSSWTVYKNHVYKICFHLETANFQHLWHRSLEHFESSSCN